MQGYGVIEARTRRARVRGRHAEVVLTHTGRCTCGQVLRRPYVTAWYRQLLERGVPARGQQPQARDLDLWFVTLARDDDRAISSVDRKQRRVVPANTEQEPAGQRPPARQAALNQDLVWRGSLNEPAGITDSRERRRDPDVGRHGLDRSHAELHRVKGVS